MQSNQAATLPSQRYGGLVTDHPLLQEIIWQKEPDFPSVRRDLSRAVNELEKQRSDTQIIHSLLLSAPTRGFIDPEGRNPAVRIFAALKNRFLMGQYAIPEGEDPGFGSHEETILELAKDVHSSFRAALSATETPNSPGPQSAAQPASNYNGLTTDSPAIRRLISHQAPANPLLQQALSLAINGIVQNHSQAHIHSELAVLRKQQQPTHPVTSSQQTLEISTLPRTVPATHALKDLPDNDTLLSTAKHLLSTLHQETLHHYHTTPQLSQINQRQMPQTAPAHPRGKHSVYEPPYYHSPVEKIREKFRSLGKGR